MDKEAKQTTNDAIAVGELNCKVGREMGKGMEDEKKKKKDRSRNSGMEGKLGEK